jgi:hypothetical protein
VAGLIDELVSILETEERIYADLIPILQKKTQVIIDNDLDLLTDITNREQAAVDDVTALERKRDGVIVNIGTVLSKDPKTLDMKTLIKSMEPQAEVQKKLTVLHDALTTTLGTMAEINNRNKMLIEQSLEMIEFNINLARSQMLPGVNNYDRNANNGYNNIPGAPGMFDTKR